jgi:hypothetical protein
MGAAPSNTSWNDTYIINQFSITLEQYSLVSVPVPLLLQSTLKPLQLTITTVKPQTWGRWRHMRWLVLRVIYWALKKQNILSDAVLTVMFDDDHAPLKRVRFMSQVHNWIDDGIINPQLEMVAKLVIPREVNVQQLLLTNTEGRMKTYRFSIRDVQSRPIEEPNSKDEEYLDHDDLIVVTVDLGAGEDRLLDTLDDNTKSESKNSNVVATQSKKPEKRGNFAAVAKSMLGQGLPFVNKIVSGVLNNNKALRKYD